MDAENRIEILKSLNQELDNKIASYEEMNKVIIKLIILTLILDSKMEFPKTSKYSTELWPD